MYKFVYLQHFLKINAKKRIESFILIHYYFVINEAKKKKKYLRQTKTIKFSNLCGTCLMQVKKYDYLYFGLVWLVIHFGLVHTYSPYKN